MYDDCGFEHILVTLGKRVNSLSGFFDMCVNLFFRYFQITEDLAWQQSIIDAIDQANLSGAEEDWEKVGYPVGAMFAEFMNFEIPSFELQYGEYNTRTTIA